jgi:hypothetical protein
VSASGRRVVSFPLCHVELKLRKGATYELWCSLQEPEPYRAQGMEATLAVRKHTK